MNKTFKIIVSGVIAVVICYFICFFYGIIRYSHSSDWQTYKQYMWFFKDSVRSEIDTSFSYSYIKKRDVYNNFHFKGSYNIIIWEFKDLGKAELKNVSVNQNVDLDNIKFSSGEILNKKSDLEITIKRGFAFNYTMNVNLDRNSKIERNIEGANYKGFYGSINKMSLSNEKNEHQIILDYTKGQTPTVFLLYKGQQSFYFIMINSEKPFNESIIKMLNLE
ncbi:MAG: hypothetical protein Q8862_06670 [Bacteroidota bacterium]|nr:hypothetical protein [Bacteroidota bacterium]